MNLTTENHVWMMPSWYNSDWYLNVDSTNCTVDEVGDYSLSSLSPFLIYPPIYTHTHTHAQMIEAVRYAFYLDSFNNLDNPLSLNTPTDLGNVSYHFWILAYFID